MQFQKQPDHELARGGKKYRHGLAGAVSSPLLVRRVVSRSTYQDRGIAL